MASTMHVPRNPPGLRDDPPACPYVGLVPYTEQEAAYFYGRQRDSRLILDNMGAYPLTVLYGPSGVGKSSVLRAGVLRLQRDESEHRRQRFGVVEDAVAYFSEWRDDPQVTLPRVIASSIRDALGSVPGSPAPPPDIRSIASTCNEAGINLYIVLDQFEEYFLYHDHDGDLLGRQLAGLLDESSRITLLISIREDNLAKLDRFEAALPSIFSRTLRLEHLDREAAREAILGPLERFNSEVPPSDRRTIEPSFVEEILDQVQTGRVRVTASGGKAEGPSRRHTRNVGRIEAPFLQLVLTRIWEEETAAHSKTLRLDTLTRLGGAQSIVREHLNRVVADFEPDEHELLAALFGQLVTPGGTKIAHSASNLALLTDGDPDTVLALLKRLCGYQRILRETPPADDDPGSEPRFEIFHDVLALAVLDWRRRWQAVRERDLAHRALLDEKDRAEAEAREGRARLRRARLLVGSLAILLVACLVLAGVAFTSTRQASKSEQRALQSARQAEQNALLVNVNNDLEVDPQRALREALRAWQPGGSARTEAAVRRSFDAATGALVLDLGERPVISATFTNAGSRLVTVSEDGLVRVFEADSGRQLMKTDVGKPMGSRNVYSVQVSPYDDLAIIGARHSAAVVPLDGAEPKVLSTPGMQGTVDVSSVSGHGPPLAITFGYDGTGAQVWNLETGDLMRTLADGRQVSAVALDEEGHFAATSTYDDKLRIWDITTGAVIATTDLDDVASALHFSPAQGGVLVGAASRNVSAFRWKWRRPGGRHWVHYWLVQYQVASVDFNPASHKMVISGDKSTYSFSSGGYAYQTATSRDWVNASAVSQDGHLTASATNDGEVIVGFADRDNARPLWVFRGHGAPVNDVEFSPSGDRVVSAGADGTVRVWRLPTPLRAWGTPGYWALAARFTGDGDEVVVATTDRKVQVLNAHTGIESWSGDIDGLPSSIDVSPDAQRLLVGLPGRLTPLVMDRNEEELPTFRKHDYFYLTRLRWSPSPTVPIIVAGNRNNEVIAWDAEAGGRALWATPLGEGYNAVVDLEFAHDAGKVVALSEDGGLSVLDADDGVVLRTLQVGSSTDVAVSVDGRFAATAGEDQIVRVWDLSDSKSRPKHEFDDTVGTLGEVAFSTDPESRWVAAVGADGITYVWDRETGQLRAALRRHADSVNAVAFDPQDPTRLLTASDDGSVAIYRCTPCDLDGAELVAAARERVAVVRATDAHPSGPAAQAGPDPQAGPSPRQ